MNDPEPNPMAHMVCLFEPSKNGRRPAGVGWASAMNVSPAQARQFAAAILAAADQADKLNEGAHD